MEFIRDNLHTLIEKEGGQPIDKALSILRQIALRTRYKLEWCRHRV
jgi:hypothetical protein